MKKLLPFIVFLFVFSAFGQSFKDKIAKFDKAKSYVVYYDKFKDITTVTSPKHVTKGPSKWWMPGITVYAVIEFPGQEPKLGTVSNYLVLWSGSADWRFLNSRHLILLADSNKIEFAYGERSGQVNRGSVYEYLYYKPTADQWKILMNSKTIEYQANGVEGKFDEKFPEIAKNMLSLIAQ